MGPKKSICVKLKNSTVLFGCFEASKEGSHRTIYESANRTGIQTNHSISCGYCVWGWSYSCLGCGGYWYCCSPRHTLEASAVASGIPADMVDKAAGIAAVV